MHEFMLMEPTNQTFQELVGNGVKYTVPRFQRDYAWDTEQWEELWDDISTLAKEHYHYMGYIVLQRMGKHDFQVIDGQQRLVTLSLIVLAAMKQIKNLIERNIEAADNAQRLAVLTDRFIGAKNPISLKVDNKLSLNRNNGTHFKSICSNLEAPNKRKLTQTNKLLHKAFRFFSAKKMGSSGTQIAEFIEQLSSGMVFTKIVVQDNLNAYKVFETLNARGVQLSTPDLLKNYIFSVVTKNNDVSDEDLNDLDENWSEIISQLGEANFTDFIRYHHNFQKKLVTKKALFSSVRSLSDTPQKAYRYLNSLIDYAPIYASLLSPYDDWWAAQGEPYRQARKYLDAFSLFNIKQPFTILMVAFQKFSGQEFIKLLRYLYVLSVRYNVICHYSPKEQETLYNQMAMQVFDGSFKRASHVKNSAAFRKLYPEDKAFMNVFEFHKMPSRQSSKKIRFLLAEIEAYRGHASDYAKMQLEHICPYHPEQSWCEAFGEGVNDIQDRLGNMVLLEKDMLKRTGFQEKITCYQQSPFPLAQKVAEYEYWNLKNLNDYQAWLAQQAVDTWAID
ncbi:DUF262 domain-containing protein [Candidatus Venteria ishoeyi]|uniref:DUF262 domain-containing protein n=1 Tax=Candidatus Venteria ishoeyi TaxID=1899563 RepID=A0A1H6FCX3_9GAMM|nr:DUF262 domain-containing protein [Candidatus Venteria ishoeyi]MDM8546930.1 DUF262 domain-containing protein [Candidatus Venteria ishoeyi]SEH07483.1 Uncharacterised protein [Candidatus Venteria ishoeyi]